jgi:hypothetical protein
MFKTVAPLLLSGAALTGATLCPVNVLETFDDLATGGPRVAGTPIGTYNGIKFQDFCKSPIVIL